MSFWSLVLGASRHMRAREGHQGRKFEQAQMWVWPQVPRGGPSPSTPCRQGRLPRTRLGRPLPEHCKKSQGVGGKREGESGEGRAAAWGRSSCCNGGMGGTFQRAVGPGPTSGGSRKEILDKLLEGCIFSCRSGAFEGDGC